MKYKKEKIGLLIEQRMNALGINKSELARRIGISNQYVNRLFEKDGIDTDKLVQISQALDYDFFAHFRPEEPKGDTTNGDNSPFSQNINSNIHAAPSLSDSEQLELAQLRIKVAATEAQLQEKERTIQILLNALSTNNQQNNPL